MVIGFLQVYFKRYISFSLLRFVHIMNNLLEYYSIVTSSTARKEIALKRANDLVEKRSHSIHNSISNGLIKCYKDLLA